MFFYLMSSDLASGPCVPPSSLFSSLKACVKSGLCPDKKERGVIYASGDDKVQRGSPMDDVRGCFCVFSSWLN